MKKIIMQSLKFSLYLAAIAIVLAYFEVQIEGPNGWASALPTWRNESPNLTWIFGGRPITGYHVALNILLLLFFHWPFVFTKWSFSNETKVIAAFTLLAVVWDFLWFVINPNFGLKKYNSDNVWWFKNWCCGVPIDYFFGIIMTLIIRFLPVIFEKQKRVEVFIEGILFVLFCIIEIVTFTFLFSMIIGNTI